MAAQRAVLPCTAGQPADSQFCSSDPHCAEKAPDSDGMTLHAAACHACLFSPETSCENGNKYLDRGLLMPTLSGENLAFFNQG